MPLPRIASGVQLAAMVDAHTRYAYIHCTPMASDLPLMPATDHPESSVPNADRCPNCGSADARRFCPDCGQSREPELREPATKYLRRTLYAFFTLDSRIWVTLRLLVRYPGELTLEYWRGRRARYVPPLRLYLVISFFAFLFQAVGEPQITVSDGEDTATDSLVQQLVDPDSPSEQSWIVQQILKATVEMPEQLAVYFRQRLPWAAFAVLPIFAAMLRLLYRRKERFFAPHMICALHIFSAGFLLVAVGGMIDWFLDDQGQAAALVGALVLMVLALKRVYAQRWWLTIFKAGVLAFANAMISGLAVLLVLILSVLLL